MRRVREFLFADAGQRNKFRGLAVAERDRPGLVEKQRVDVASGFDRASRHGQNIESHETVHSGNSNRRQERADRGRNEGNKKRDEHDHADAAARIIRKARDGRDRDDKNDASIRREEC